MLGLDFLYLSTFGKFFNNLVQSIQGSVISMNLTGAILCYILLIFGLNYFIIDPKQPIADAFLLGIVIYGVYETTNYAILKKWTPQAVALDTLWGGVLMATTAKLTFLFS